MNESRLLALRGVAKRFGAVQALDGVDLEIAAGEIVAVVGENGSGKSTLARIVAGALRRDAGELLVDGVPRDWSRPRDALGAGIALVTQELTAVPEMSIAENVLLPALGRVLSPVRRRGLAARAQPYLDAVGLDADPCAPFASLAPGRRELVEIAKALAAEPRLLVLDESTARLPDPEPLFRLVERLCEERGLGLLFITHRLAEIRRLARRAVVLRDGRVAGQLARSDLSDERLTSLMVGRELTSFFHKANVQRVETALEADELVTERSPHPLSFLVRRGEIVGIAGLVGSGRTELLETLAGARRRRGGRVAVGGREITGHSVRAARRAGIALVPEDRRAQGLVLDASVRANVAMGDWQPLRAANRGRERDAAEEAVLRLRIRCAGVEAPVRTLSGGNQQKVVLARSLAHEPRVLLLDEPTRGVDVGAREEIYAILSGLVEQGLAVVVASSELTELLGLADRILVLNDGRLAADLSRADATEERIMLAAAGEVQRVA